MKWFDWAVILALPINIVSGCGAALFVALLETRLRRVGLRNYIVILLLSVALTGAIIEWFLLKTAPWVCFLLGVIIGRGADNLLLSIDDTMPTFVHDVVRDVQQHIRRLLGLKWGVPPDDDAPSEPAESEPEIAPLAHTPKRKRKKNR